MSVDRLVIGITGNMGSGKSTALRKLVELGSSCIDMDKVAHELYSTDEKLKQELIQEFGKETVIDGVVNRDYLRTLVWGKTETQQKNKKRLDEIVWPKLTSELDKRKKLYKGIVCIEAAMLYEAKWDSHVDIIFLLYCPDEIRKIRIAERVNISINEAEERMKYSGQLSQTEKTRRILASGGYIIDTSRSFPETHAQIEKAYQKLIEQFFQKNKQKITAT